AEHCPSRILPLLDPIPGTLRCVSRSQAAVATSGEPLADRQHADLEPSRRTDDTLAPSGVRCHARGGTPRAAPARPLPHHHAPRRSAGLPSQLFNRVRAPIEAIEMPAGYSLEWGGEYEDSGDAQRALAKPLPYFLALMVFIVVCLFNSIRTTLLIW